MTAEQALDRLRQTLLNSGAFDNFECGYGPRLGTCPPSNRCVECETYRVLSEYDGGKIDTTKVTFDRN
jgi:hypothetical protein